MVRIESSIHVKLFADAPVLANLQADQLDNTDDLITTDSGDFVQSPYHIDRLTTYRRLNKVSWEPETILKNANLLLEKSLIFKETGNVHSVMLCQGAEMLYFCEDIGRYNALDKCIGRALKDGTALDQAGIYTSGRIPSSVALKAIQAGIPMIVSRSAPTDATLELAAEYGLTVIGFAKGNKFNVYVS